MEDMLMHQMGTHYRCPKKDLRVISYRASRDSTSGRPMVRSTWR
jgi:hypothetical protein